MSSSAFAGPTSRGRKYVPPQSGCNPRLTKAWENFAAEEATRSLPFTRPLIEDCGAGARRRQTYARAYILRRLRQMGLLSH